MAQFDSRVLHNNQLAAIDKWLTVEKITVLYYMFLFTVTTI